MRMVYLIDGKSFSIGVDGIEEAATIAARLQRTEGAKCMPPVDGEGDPMCSPDEWARRVTFHAVMGR